MSGGNLASNIKIKGASEPRHLHNQSVSVVSQSTSGYGKINMSSIENLAQAPKKAIAMHQKNQSVNTRSNVNNHNNNILLNNSSSMMNAGHQKQAAMNTQHGVTSASPGGASLDGNSQNQIRQSVNNK